MHGPVVLDQVEPGGLGIGRVQLLVEPDQRRHAQPRLLHHRDLPGGGVEGPRHARERIGAVAPLGERVRAAGGRPTRRERRLPIIGELIWEQQHLRVRRRLHLLPTALPVGLFGEIRGVGAAHVIAGVLPMHPQRLQHPPDAGPRVMADEAAPAPDLVQRPAAARLVILPRVALHQLLQAGLGRLLGAAPQGEPRRVSGPAPVRWSGPPTRPLHSGPASYTACPDPAGAAARSAPPRRPVGRWQSSGAPSPVPADRAWDPAWPSVPTPGARRRSSTTPAWPPPSPSDRRLPGDQFA
jgi:hypothetical protein